MKKVVIQGDMILNGQRKWEIHTIDDEDIKSTMERAKSEADNDLHKFCRERTVGLLSGNIILGDKHFSLR